MDTHGFPLLFQPSSDEGSWSRVVHHRIVLFENGLSRFAAADCDRKKNFLIIVKEKNQPTTGEEKIEESAVDVRVARTGGRCSWRRRNKI